MGGRNQDAVVFATLSCYFSLKSHKYGLKWKFRSSFVFRINNCYPLLCDFVVGQFWSKVGLLLKYFSFCYINFWKIILFDKYVQYAHQMKAENILNSNCKSNGAHFPILFYLTRAKSDTLWVSVALSSLKYYCFVKFKILLLIQIPLEIKMTGLRVE